MRTRKSFCMLPAPALCSRLVAWNVSAWLVQNGDDGCELISAKRQNTVCHDDLACGWLAAFSLQLGIIRAALPQVGA